MQIPSPDHILLVAVPLLLRSVVHHAYHKACHWLIHTSGHRFHAFGAILSRCKWLTDVILVAFLTLFGAATEHEAPEHETPKPQTQTKSE